MKTDIEIAQEATMRPIIEIAKEIGIEDDEIELYGKFKCKVSLDIMERLKDRPEGKLVLVTAITPTPMGEGKTTIAIGLGSAMYEMGYNVINTLREPSLGPVFGIKGGAAGGGSYPPPFLFCGRVYNRRSPYTRTYSWQANHPHRRRASPFHGISAITGSLAA